jgi:putative methionine-R-sulfoxide reductase with GAF domain
MKSLKISSIILPILTSLLLIIFLGSLDTNFTLYKQLSCAVLFIYNIFIFLSFLAFGVAGSVIYVSIFSAIALFVATLTHSYFLNFHILIYITLDAFLYYQKRVTENIKGSRLAKIESIEKDINLLKEEYNKRQSQAKAYQKKFSKFAILKDVVEKLSTSLSVPEVANLIVSKSFNIIGKADICKLFLVDEKKHKLVLTSVRKSEEYKNLKIKEPDHFDKRVFNKKEPLAIQDIRKDYRFDYEAIKDKIVDFRSTIATPLISKGRSIGVLRLDSSRPGNLSTEDLRLLNILADLTAV